MQIMPSMREILPAGLSWANARRFIPNVKIMIKQAIRSCQFLLNIYPRVVIVFRATCVCRIGYLYCGLIEKSMCMFLKKVKIYNKFEYLSCVVVVGASRAVICLPCG